MSRYTLQSQITAANNNPGLLIVLYCLALQKKNTIFIRKTNLYQTHDGANEKEMEGEFLHIYKMLELGLNWRF